MRTRGYWLVAGGVVGVAGAVGVVFAGGVLGATFVGLLFVVLFEAFGFAGVPVSPEYML